MTENTRIDITQKNWNALAESTRQLRQDIQNLMESEKKRDRAIMQCVNEIDRLNRMIAFLRTSHGPTT